MHTTEDALLGLIGCTSTILVFSINLTVLLGPVMNSGLPADGTMAAAVIYTIGDLHRPGCIIDYPRGGGGAVIGAMVRLLDRDIAPSK